jgi:hypothetical protein
VLTRQHAARVRDALATLRAGAEARVGLDRAGAMATRSGANVAFTQGIANAKNHAVTASLFGL